MTAELFGHERERSRVHCSGAIGRFEVAEGGTLFLDEIGELPAETQLALLRCCRSASSTSGNAADSRRRAGHCRHESGLARRHRGWGFRSDLFYRLNVFPLEVPSLRDRRDDIPLLIEWFVRRYANRAGRAYAASTRARWICCARMTGRETSESSRTSSSGR